MSDSEMREKDIAPIEDLPGEVDFSIPDDSDSEQSQQPDILKSLEDAANGVSEEEEDDGICDSWETERLTINQLLWRLKNGKLVFPLCQRLYVWNDKQRMSLVDSVCKNLPCGNITFAVSNGISYLLDGLQRTTALMISTNDPEISDEVKKKILSYKVVVVSVYGLSSNGMKQYFQKLNSGIALAAAVKERSTLPENLSNAILDLSSREFFRKQPTSATFNKAHHHELIACNSLLAAAGITQGDNKAKALCKSIKDNSELVLSHVGDATKLIERVETIFQDTNAEASKRALNANYIGSLLYVMARYPDFTNAQIIAMTETVYAGAHAIKPYAETTRTGAADTGMCRKRQEFMVEYMKQNGEKASAFKEEKFEQWIKNQGRNPIAAFSDHTIIVDFAEFERPERMELFMAQQNNDPDAFDKVVFAIYNRLDNEPDVTEKQPA